MSKKTVEPTIGYGRGMVSSASIYDYIIGATMEIIEAIGLPDKQESAVKNMIKERLYGQMQHNVWIDEDVHRLLREAEERKIKNEDFGDVTMKHLEA